MDNRQTSTVVIDRREEPMMIGSKRDTKKIVAIIAFVLAIAVLVCFCTVIIAEIVYKINGEPAKGPNNAAGDVRYTTSALSSDEIHRGNLILVKEGYSYVFPSNNEHLISIYSIKSSSYRVSSDKLLIDKSIAENLNTFMDAAKEATSCSDIIVKYAYRSYSDQEELAHYDDEPDAGFSEHHTGNCIDINLYDMNDSFELTENKALYDWLMANAHKYGFINRYPDEKKNITGVDHDCESRVRTTHFTYVGYAHAYYMSQNDICLEEYLELLSANYKYDNQHLCFVGDDGNSYEIYYVRSSGAQTNVPVPENYEYTVSGDNMNGFIVTVQLSSPAQ